MPNTLAHIGVQGFVSSMIWRQVDSKWFYLGVVIPDIPWIVQRIVQRAVPLVGAVDARAYLEVQASLAGCILLCIALGSLSRFYRQVIAVLIVNSVFHLVLDATEIKWGNGVQFFVPFSSAQMNWGVFWPESITGIAITCLGLLYVVYSWRSRSTPPSSVDHWAVPVRRRVVSGLFLLAYLTMPFVGMSDASSVSADFVPGEYVEFDRARVELCEDGFCLEGPDGSTWHVLRLDVKPPVVASLKARRVAENRLMADDYHVHARYFRDGASYVGLFAILVVWLTALNRERKAGSLRG